MTPEGENSGFLQCTLCEGYALSAAEVRVRLVTPDKGAFTPVVSSAPEGEADPLDCPFCEQLMKRAVGLEHVCHLCSSCNAVWFDTGVLRSLQKELSPDIEALKTRRLAQALDLRLDTPSVVSGSQSLDGSTPSPTDGSGSVQGQARGATPRGRKHEQRARRARTSTSGSKWISLGLRLGLAGVLMLGAYRLAVGFFPEQTRQLTEGKWFLGCRQKKTQGAAPGHAVPPKKAEPRPLGSGKGKGAGS